MKRSVGREREWKKRKVVWQFRVGQKASENNFYLDCVRIFFELQQCAQVGGEIGEESSEKKGKTFFLPPPFPDSSSQYGRAWEKTIFFFSLSLFLFFVLPIESRISIEESFVLVFFSLPFLNIHSNLFQGRREKGVEGYLSRSWDWLAMLLLGRAVTPKYFSPVFLLLFFKCSFSAVGCISKGNSVDGRQKNSLAVCIRNLSNWLRFESVNKLP